MLIFVLTDAACQKKGAVGCSAEAGIFVLSKNNCHGGTGKKGCEGMVWVFDPNSAGNCVAGDGGPVFRAIK